MEEFGERRGGFRRRGFGGGHYNMSKPVSVGDVLDVTIESTGSKGDGLAKKEGFVIFVKGASQGQTVKIKIISVGRTSATAEVVGDEAAPSSASAEPPSGEGSAMQNEEGMQ